MKPDNPFILSGYASPEFFCDRTNETEKIISALKNSRNITLFSIRRMGKTGLIEHVFYKFKDNRQISYFYLDILPTNGLGDFINALASAVLGKLESKPEKFLNKIGEIFSSLRPVISYDPLTGSPNLQLNIQSSEEASKSLEKVFAYLKQSKRKIIIALDEFQQITNYPENNVEAILRANIQQAGNISFIFSGSQKHILLSIFSQYGKPFYQSTEMMQLERIKSDEYAEFIHTKFSKGKKKINGSAIKSLLEICRNHTYYVQFLCNRLYGLRDSQINDTLVFETLQSILHENEPVYINYKNLLTNYQWNVLKAIAHEGNANLLTSKDFIRTYNLGAPSSVHSAVKALLNKEMIYKENEDYFIYDVFLERWLESF